MTDVLRIVTTGQDIIRQSFPQVGCVQGSQSNIDVTGEEVGSSLSQPFRKTSKVAVSNFMIKGSMTVG